MCGRGPLATAVSRSSITAASVTVSAMNHGLMTGRGLSRAGNDAAWIAISTASIQRDRSVPLIKAASKFLAMQDNKRPLGLFFMVKWRYGGPTMSKGEQTRQRIIAEAASLFNRRGYHGSSLQDLME